MEHVNTWPAPSTSRPVHATVTVPGSKSQTNRALVLAALAAADGGVSTISGALRSRDTDLMIGALEALGLRIDGPADELAVSGTIAPPADAHIDCGLAGTVLRFVPPLAALGLGPAGDVRRRRAGPGPADRAAAECAARCGRRHRRRRAAVPGARRRNGRRRGGRHRCVSLVAVRLRSAARRSVVHRRPGRAPRGPVAAVGAAHRDDGGDAAPGRRAGRRRDHQPLDTFGRGAVAARHWHIEPDLSNAVPFIAAAVVSAGTVRITGWPAASIQPADTILSILGQLNCVVKQDDSYLEVQGPQSYPGFDVNLRDVGELTPSVAVLAALAAPGSVSRLSGIAHLRGHETDRLAALSTEINRLGGDCRETADGLEITAVALRPGTWQSYADHRMATAGAIIGLRVDGVEVDDIETTAKTLPNFPAMWADMLRSS